MEKKNGRFEILITEIPYMVNKTRLIESIADLVKDKRIEGISDLNDESSSRTGMKIVIEIKKDANPQVVLNQLYRYTQLQDTVGVIMLALDDGVPRIMSLKTVMERYIDFQMEVIRRRTAHDLKKAQEREHILEGLHKAVDIVDEIIATIRACKGGFAEARQAVMDRFDFDEPQADAIVKLQLGPPGRAGNSQDRAGNWTNCAPPLRITRTSGQRRPCEAHRQAGPGRPGRQVRRRAPHLHRGGVRRGGHRGPDPRGDLRLYP